MDDRDEFMANVAKTALDTIDKVRAGEAPIDMETFLGALEDMVTMIEASLHLLAHAGVENEDVAMWAIARAQACEARHHSLDLSPEAAMASLYLAMEEHRILFPEQYMDELDDDEEGHQ